MRVICLVPSLTETLIECGVNVVGRTRFCIHPDEQVKKNKTVGGTKGVNWQKCADLKPDLVVFDREENLKEMADQCPFDWHATHITSVENIGDELIELAAKLANPALLQHGRDWNQLAQKPNIVLANNTCILDSLSGVIHSLNNKNSNYKRIEYMIWREPWMAIGQNTFIHSVLDKMGLGAYLAGHSQPYPQLNEQQMQREDTFYLFSSEPYPFAKHKQSLIEDGFNGAIVDGEVYSWYGIRSYRYLSEYFSETL